MSTSTKARKRAGVNNKRGAKANAANTTVTPRDANERKVFLVAGIIVAVVLLLLYLVFRSN